MGQCCVKFNQNNPPQQNNKTDLLPKGPITTFFSTRNDQQFTYFLGVFNLQSLGQKLQLPEYIDEMHPNFSYQRFHDSYHQYQKQIINLGKYIESTQNINSPTYRRIESDRSKISAFRNQKKLPKGKTPGCLVKIQLQDIRWNGAKQIGVTLVHPLHWEGKFQRWTKREFIDSGPVFFQFAVPQYKGAIIKIGAKGLKSQILLNIEQSIANGEQVFCKIMKWRGAAQKEGIAVRMQLVNQNSEDEYKRMEMMREVHKKLVQDYGINGQIEVSMTDQDINERLSRHRSSLHKKYNLSMNHHL